jgi:hypothetical protein
MNPSLTARACLWRDAPTGGNAACPSSVSETLAYSRRAEEGFCLGASLRPTVPHDESRWSRATSPIPVYGALPDGHPLHHRWFPLAGVYAGSPRHLTPTVARLLVGCQPAEAAKAGRFLPGPSTWASAPKGEQL